MKSKLLSAIALLFLLTSSEIAAAQDLASQLVGVWKFTVVAQKYVGNEELTKSWGENPGGMMSFSRGGYFINTMHADGRKAPAGAKPTDAELAELFRTIFFGSGTYKVEGDKVILRYESSSAPSWSGTERRSTMAVSGKILTWTGPEFKDGAGKAYNNIFKLERLE
jgi:hypothetical protein